MISEIAKQIRKVRPDLPWSVCIIIGNYSEEIAKQTEIELNNDGIFLPKNTQLVFNPLGFFEEAPKK